MCFIEQSWRLGMLNLLKAQVILSWVLDARHGSSTLGVCPTGFWSFFGSIFSYYVSILLFWSRNVLRHYTLKVCKLPFDFTGADSYEIALRIRHGGILPHGGLSFNIQMWRAHTFNHSNSLGIYCTFGTWNTSESRLVLCCFFTLRSLIFHSIWDITGTIWYSQIVLRVINQTRCDGI